MPQRPAPPLLESVLKNREHTVMGLAGSPESVLLGFRETELLLVNSASVVCGRWVGRKGEVSKQLSVRELWACLSLLEVSGVGKEEVLKFGDWVRD